MLKAFKSFLLLGETGREFVWHKSHVLLAMNYDCENSKSD